MKILIAGGTGAVGRRLVPLLVSANHQVLVITRTLERAADVRATSSSVFNVADDEPARASDWIPAFADAVGAPKPFRLPVFVARLAIRTAMTEWLTTMRGASNAKIKAELGWRLRYPSWREGFRHLA